MKMNEVERAVYETNFVLYDLMLYLDTHPEDTKALEYYRKAREDWKQARCAYVEHFGPLTFDDVTGEDRWNWIDRPWPWEGGACGCGSMKNACSSR